MQKKILTAANTAYFTYTPKSQKPHTYLLKGLGNSYTEAEILEDLKALNIEEVNFTKVTRFTTRKSRENNTLLPI